MFEVVTGSVKVVTVGVLTLAEGRETVATTSGVKGETDSLVGADAFGDVVGDEGVKSPFVSPMTNAS